jgi:hypothetical protein
MEALEPEVKEAIHEVVDAMIVKVQEIQMIAVESPEAEVSDEIIEELETLVIELCELAQFEVGEEQIKRFVQLLITQEYAQTDGEESLMDFLFSDQGTHEGLRYLMKGIQALQQLLPSVHALLGKYALMHTQPLPLVV